MGFRFRKSFGPRGLKVNITKNGISSVSIGRAPFTVNIPVNRSGGVRTTASIPGSGLSWSEQAPANPQRRRAPLPSQGSPELEAYNRRIARQDLGLADGDSSALPHLVAVLAALLLGVPLGLTLLGSGGNELQIRRCNQGELAACAMVSDGTRITNPEYLAGRKREAAASEAAAEQRRAEIAADQQRQREEQQRLQAQEQQHQQELEASRQRAVTAREQMNRDGYYQGAEGGCFRYTSGGNKDYVDHSICTGY